MTTMETSRANDGFEIIAGRSRRLSEVVQRAKRIAGTACTVLISGETGTGKEVFARAIHSASSCATGPFVAINCAAISRDLLESELFGHVQGAFTSANKNRKGHFQMADGGTLLLDEIGEMSIDLQAKLLRAIQFQEFCAVGDSITRKVDVRILAATNANLAELVRTGQFRSDLYYRLNVINLTLPSLRERLEDIGDLSRSLLPRLSGRYGRHVTDISSEAIDVLCKHNWPGNIRELENALEFAVVMGGGDRIQAEDLPEIASEQDISDFLLPLCDEGIDLPSTLRKIEAYFIEAALEKTQGNKNRAATLLGLNRTTLVEKLKRGVPRELAVGAC